MASAGPHANLHLTADRLPHQHLIPQFLQAGCPSCRPTNIDATALWDPWDASPPTLEIIATKCPLELLQLFLLFIARNCGKLNFTGETERKVGKYNNGRNRSGAITGYCEGTGWKIIRASVISIKGSPYSTTERRVPVLGSQPAGDESHKPGGRLSLLSARPAVTPATLKRAATNFAAR